MDCIITAIMLTAYYLHNSFFARNIIMYENWKYTAKKQGNKQKKEKNSAKQTYKELKLNATCVSMCKSRNKREKIARELYFLETMGRM